VSTPEKKLFICAQVLTGNDNTSTGTLGISHKSDSDIERRIGDLVRLVGKTDEAKLLQRVIGVGNELAQEYIPEHQVSKCKRFPANYLLVTVERIDDNVPQTTNIALQPS
jgi:hypothetical protein